MAFGPFLLLATLEGLVMAAVLALTAVGLSLVFGVMRVVNVAHGEFFMLGAVSAWFVTQALPGPPWLGFAVALVAAPLLVAGIAVLADRLVLKRLGYDPEATIVATIGLLYILQQATLGLYGPDARPVAPTAPTRAPCFTSAPTATSMRLKWMKVELRPWPWSMTSVPPVRRRSGLAKVTTPSAGATTALPSGAATSTP